APVARPAAGGTRVGTVNLPMILKNYEKFKQFESQLQGLVTHYTKQEESYRAQLVSLQKDSTQPENQNQAKKDEIELKAKELKRRLEDVGAAKQKDIASRGEVQLVQLYREIEDAVRDTARSMGFDLILQYSEPLNPTDMYSPM